MPIAPQWSFGPFRLDPDDACVWHGAQAIPLKPKTCAVLQYLVAHAGRLVTKEELFEAVWPEIAVGDAVLKVCIAAIRKVLGDTAKTPQFIATVHRRGYRFIAPVTSVEPLKAGYPPPSIPDISLPSPSSSVHSPEPLVEREAVLRALHERLAQARQGVRQVVFVTGEPGVGKTAVVEAFTAQVAVDPQVQIARGQCVEHYGLGEPYLPVLEALGQLCREPGHERLIALLRQQAPTWLVQMPWLLSAADRGLLQQELQGATRERMLRELAEVVDTLTAEAPLVLVLEDLHWSDYATLDLLALLARRREPARLLLIGTYLPVEVIVHGHPLHAVKQDLQSHGHCTELPLALLSDTAVATYLAERFPRHQLPAALTLWLHRHTDGNPLFLVTTASALVERGVLVEQDGRWTLQAGLDAVAVEVPEGLRQMLEQQIARVPVEAQRVLEAASAVGVTFAAAEVAAGLEEDVWQIEERCERLAREWLFLRPEGMATWPDKTVATRYQFTHALYQQVAYQRLGVGRRLQLHQRIGTRLEEAYGSGAGEIAAELAEHFVRGQDTRRAVRYLQQAAENATRRYAYREVIGHLTRALTLLQSLPDTPERAQQELALHVALGPVLIATKGYAAPDVERVYTRARQLCHHLGEPRQLFPVLVGLRRFHQVRAEFHTAHELGVRLLTMAQSLQEPALLLEAHFGLGIALFYLGEFAASCDHCEQGLGHYDVRQSPARTLLFGQDPGVACHPYVALALWAMGYPEQALHRGREALTLARQVAHPFSLAFALLHVALLHAARREGQAAQAMAEAALALAQEQDFAFWLARGRFLRGWAVAVQGDGEAGIAQMRQGLEAARATGAEVGRSGFLALLAEAYGAAAQPERGLEVLAEALAQVDNTGERWWAAEVHRLQGELLLAQTGTWPPAARDLSQGGEAEVCFQHALAIARQQQAKSWELRAAMSLARLWQQQGQRTEARQVLTGVYGWFTEGFDTRDLQEAKALLEELK